MENLNVYQKINEVKKILKKFTKDESTSGKGAYTYTSGSQILSAIKDKMEEVGLLFIPVGTEHRSFQTYNYQNSYGDTKTDFLVDGKLFYEWINIDNPTDRQRVEFEYYGQQNDLSKAFGSALTYSERYILLKSLGVPTDEDDPDKKNENKTQKSQDDKGEKKKQPKNGEKKELTLEEAENMVIKRKDGTEAKLKDLDVVDLGNILSVDKPSLDKIKEGAKLILKAKENGN